MAKIIRVGACNHCGLCCHPDCEFIVRDQVGVHCKVFLEDVTSSTGCSRKQRVLYPSYTDRLVRSCGFRFVMIDEHTGAVLREVTMYRKSRRNLRGTTVLDEFDLEWRAE
ncbi:MAG: hypothetical protein QW587_04545 [Candidatus Bathyarchaeia archaeon]